MVLDVLDDGSLLQSLSGGHHLQMLQYEGRDDKGDGEIKSKNRGISSF